MNVATTDTDTTVMRVEVTPEETVELFTVLNAHRDHLFDTARRPADIKAALTFHQLVVRLHVAYARAVPS